MSQQGASSSALTSVPPRFYKPFILRAPGLLFIFAICLALIAILEYAARTLPLVENRIHVPEISKLSNLLQRRQDTQSSFEVLEVSAASTFPTILTNVMSGDNGLFASAKPFERPWRLNLAARTVSPSTSPAITTPPTSMPSSASTTPVETATTMPGEYLAISSVSTSTAYTSATIPSAYVPTTSTLTESPQSISPGTINSPNWLTETFFSTNPGAYVTTNSYSTGVASTNAYLATATKVLVSTSLSTDAVGQVNTILNTYTITQTQQIITQTGLSTVITTNSAGYAQTATVPYTSVETLQPSPDSTQDNNSKFQTVLITWPLWWVFVAGYLPLLLAIFVKIFWTSLYANVKLLEPFIQLSHPDGALASDVLHTFYLSSNLTPDPIMALFKGRWLMFWTSSAYLVVGLLAPLASEVLFLDLHYGCGSEMCWPPKLSADGTVLRLLQGLLSFIAIMSLTIMFMVYRSTTGVYSNPSSIASIACLLHHPEVLDDFRSMNDNISSKSLKAHIGDKRYQLGMYQGQDRVQRYGIIPATQTYSPGWTQISLKPATESIKPEKKTHRISFIIDIVFVTFIFGLLGVVVAYFLDGSNSGFNRFFNSNLFGPRFFMSSMGTIIAMYWKGIERSKWLPNPFRRVSSQKALPRPGFHYFDVEIMVTEHRQLTVVTEVQTLTPFRRLIQSSAPAKSSILFQRHSLPPLVLYTSLIRGHFFAALIAFTTFLADILTITLAIIPYSPNEIYLELLICAYTSMAILGIMVLVVVGLLFWKLKLKDMPRKPDTLAGVMSYLCDSHFLADFECCERLSSEEMEKRIGRAGKRYAFGQFVGVDGKKRWMVEEESVIS
ncbi:uncharacterized protein LY89DRAFT_662720 [Mollisia scopiformis]|uniref:Uncharacterized protein n=1 Tax=Mollisia scopiformis TaxID=149040 RepID=A0A194XUE5_MOLSC|nr:uncharacterized protein LY89DRAFT_662720 [Mollisia scopiformis]KUJ23940.1 hypothetical protein LY89DRAFT_662720 [Mollisia scopiformis]